MLAKVERVCEAQIAVIHARAMHGFQPHFVEGLPVANQNTGRNQRRSNGKGERVFLGLRDLRAQMRNDRVVASEQAAARTSGANDRVICPCEVGTALVFAAGP